MEHFHIQNIEVLYGTVLPLAILMIENDEDREFISEIYVKYKGLMYKAALRYFGENPQDLEDAISGSVLNLCKYCKTVRTIPEKRLPQYIVAVVRNVCNLRYKEVYSRRANQAEDLQPEDLEYLPDDRTLHETLMDRLNAIEVLETFRKLNPRDRELIKLRHIDMLDYDEMGHILGISVTAARTAVHRAKRRLENLADEYRKHMEGK